MSISFIAKINAKKRDACPYFGPTWPEVN